MNIVASRALPALAVVCASSLSQAVTVANYTAETNRRFTDDPSFIGAGFDLSGVGRSNGFWGTAIGENYFLSANHFKPSTGSSITFTDGNSISSTSYSYTVGGGFRVGSTDLWVGYTNKAIDPAIARYAVTTQDADTLAELGLGNSTLYMNGDRIPGAPGAVQDHILATNQAESFYEEGSSQITTPGPTTATFDPPAGFENDMIILFRDNPGDDAAPLIHEALVQSGDSGSPLFAESGGTLTILGVGSLRLDDVPGNFIDTAGPSPIPDGLEERSGSAYTYAGSYTTELQTAIDRVPAPIPETSSLALLFCASAFGMRRHR
jgi:hypothetical protein